MKIKINLIPPVRKKEIEKSCILRSILRWELKLVGILFVFIAMLFSLNYILKINLSATEASQISGENGNQLKIISENEKAIKEINSQVSGLDKIQREQLYWSKLLLKLNDFVSSGIVLERVATDNFSISISGKAVSRENLTAFRDRIAGDECFSEINLPLSNFTSPENIDFQISFNIKKECLILGKKQ